MLPVNYSKTEANEILKVFFKYYQPKKIIPEIECENLDFFSLNSILTSTFNVENTAIYTSADDLITAPLPAITFLNINKGCFAVISEITENNVKWFSPKYGEQNNTLNLFRKIYSGLVLIRIV